MLRYKYKTNIEKICPICASEKTDMVNSHLYSNMRCKDCQHEAILSKEQNFEKFIEKALKKAQIKQSFNGELKNVIEYSYCPYWAFMKLGKNIDSIVIAKKQNNIIQPHIFSFASVCLYANNILVPNIIIKEKDLFIIKFQ